MAILLTPGVLGLIFWLLKIERVSEWAFQFLPYESCQKIRIQNFNFKAILITNTSKDLRIFLQLIFIEI